MVEDVLPVNKIYKLEWAFEGRFQELQQKTQLLDSRSEIKAAEYDFYFRRLPSYLYGLYYLYMRGMPVVVCSYFLSKKKTSKIFSIRWMYSENK